MRCFSSTACGHASSAANRSISLEAPAASMTTTTPKKGHARDLIGLINALTDRTNEIWPPKLSRRWGCH